MQRRQQRQRWRTRRQSRQRSQPPAQESLQRSIIEALNSQKRQNRRRSLHERSIQSNDLVRIKRRVEATIKLPPEKKRMSLETASTTEVAIISRNSVKLSRIHHHLEPPFPIGRQRRTKESPRNHDYRIIEKAVRTLLCSYPLLPVHEFNLNPLDFPPTRIVLSRRIAASSDR